MSESLKEKLEAKRAETQDRIDSEVLEGVELLADDILKARKDAREDIGKVEAKVTGKLGEFEAKHDADVDTICTKLENMEKRMTAAGRITVGDTKTALLDAMHPSHKRFVAKAESEINSKHGCHGYRDPIIKGATDAWFLEATLAQLGEKDWGNRVSVAKERRDKLSQAFWDVQKADPFAEGTSISGGNLVPTPVASEILRIVLDNGVVAGRARRVPMASKTLKIPAEGSNVSVNWIAEEGSLTSGENTFSDVTLTALKLVGKATASIELVEDSIVGLLPYVQTVFAEQMGRELDQELLEGDGTNFTGVNSATGVNSVATTTTNGEALTYGDLVQTMYSAGEQSTRDGAAWFMSPQIFATVVNLVDSNGQPIFQYANVQGSPYPTILGRPAYLTNVLNVAQTRGATGSTGNVYFGDPSTLLLGVRTDMRWDVTDQVSWANYRMDMRLVGRFGGAVATPAAWTKLVGAVKIGG